MFLRTWYPVTAVKYYNPVPSLLTSATEENTQRTRSWEAMRLVRDIRQDRGLSVPSEPDSLYKVCCSSLAGLFLIFLFIILLGSR